MSKQKSTWVIASNNSGKISEINNLLIPRGISLIAQQELNISEAPEIASTFVENAIGKAIHASKYADMPALADDSGLVVPCLNGEPGLYSARYSGSKDPQKNIELLIHNLKKLAPETIGTSPIPAYFYCVIVLLQHHKDPSPIIAQGRWDGEIILKPKGTQGFGYDSVFYDPQSGLTAAQMTTSQKAEVSHRGKALRSLLEQI